MGPSSKTEDGVSCVYRIQMSLQREKSVAYLLTEPYLPVHALRNALPLSAILIVYIRVKHEKKQKTNLPQFVFLD